MNSSVPPCCHAQDSCFPAQIWAIARTPVISHRFHVLISLMEKWVGHIETQVLDPTMKTGGPGLSRYLLPFSVPQCLRGAKVLSLAIFSIRAASAQPPPYRSARALLSALPVR